MRVVLLRKKNVALLKKKAYFCKLPSSLKTSICTYTSSYGCDSLDGQRRCCSCGADVCAATLDARASPLHLAAHAGHAEVRRSDERARARACCVPGHVWNFLKRFFF